MIRNDAIVFATFVILTTTGLFAWLRSRPGDSVLATLARFSGRVAVPVALLALLVAAGARGAGYLPLGAWVLRNAAWSLLKVAAVVLVYRWLRRSLYRTVSFYAANESMDAAHLEEEGEANPYALGVVRVTTGVLKLVLAVFTTLWLLDTWDLSLPVLAGFLSVGVPGNETVTWGRILGCYTAQLGGRFGIASRLRFAIKESLEAAGIEIPFPQQDLHIRTAPGRGPE